MGDRLAKWTRRLHGYCRYTGNSVEMVILYNYLISYCTIYICHEELCTYSISTRHKLYECYHHPVRETGAHLLHLYHWETLLASHWYKIVSRLYTDFTMISVFFVFTKPAVTDCVKHAVICNMQLKVNRTGKVGYNSLDRQLNARKWRQCMQNAFSHPRSNIFQSANYMNILLLRPRAL